MTEQEKLEKLMAAHKRGIPMDRYYRMFLKPRPKSAELDG